MDLGLAGRACVIAGADDGVGLETARRLRAEGAKVLLVAPERERLAAAAAGLDGKEEVATLPLDLTEEDAGTRMLDAAREALGGVDILVNNPSASPSRDVFEVADEDWRHRYAVSVIAPLRAMQAIAPVLAERGWGRIVNVCSAAAGRPAPTTPESSVAAAAELALSRLFADRFVKDGVLVNAVCPSAIAAEPGPAETAAAVVFLCSERASYVAGAVWPVGAGPAGVIG